MTFNDNYQRQVQDIVVKKVRSCNRLDFITVNSAPEFDAMTSDFNNLLCVSDW